jgi:predicted DNA binding CopG/RHH family protein
MSALSSLYPINTVMELTLTDSSTIKGLIYCTDEISQSIVIQRSLVHTTLSSEITVVHASSVKDSKTIEIQSGEENSSEDNIKKYGVANIDDIRNSKLCHVNRRALEERERRAMRLAEESLSHVNQKVGISF